MTKAPRAAPPAPVPAFTPVPRRFARHDGWTVARQRGFIAALASLGCVKRAAAAVSMSSEGAYALRIAPGATSFAAAWTAALDQGAERLVEIAMQRAVDGVPVPLMWQGSQVGEKRWYNDRLLMFLMKHHLPARYGPVVRPGRFPGTRGPADDEDQTTEVEEAGERIAQRIWRARANYLASIAHSPLHRAAWEILCGPTDWPREADPDADDPEREEWPAMRLPGHFIPALHGSELFPRQLGGPAELVPSEPRPFDPLPFDPQPSNSSHSGNGDGDENGDAPPLYFGDDDSDDPYLAQQGAALHQLAVTLHAEGWREDEDGNWHAPEADPEPE